MHYKQGFPRCTTDLFRAHVVDLGEACRTSVPTAKLILEEESITTGGQLSLGQGMNNER